MENFPVEASKMQIYETIILHTDVTSINIAGLQSKEWLSGGCDILMLKVGVPPGAKRTSLKPNFNELKLLKSFKIMKRIFRFFKKTWYLYSLFQPSSSGKQGKRNRTVSKKF